MANTDDILSREVGVAAKIEGTAISLKAQSRAVAAIDRLLGGLADWPAAFLEGRAAKRRVKDEVERMLMEAQAEVAERKLKGMEQAGDALLIHMFKDGARKLANVAGVVTEAIEGIRALKPPTEPQEGAAQEEPDQVDEDWFNQFTRFAEDASSDELQQLWGRVLAGEVNQPGSFSRHTLRFIAELDKTTAEHCEFAMERAIDDIIPRSQAWNESDHFSIALDLQRLGVLEGISEMSGVEKKFGHLVGQPVVFSKGGQILVVYSKDGTELKIPAIVVTRLGKEVFSLLTPIDPAYALRNLADQLKARDTVQRIELGHGSAEGGCLRFFASEVIFTRQEVAPNLQ